MFKKNVEVRRDNIVEYNICSGNSLVEGVDGCLAGKIRQKSGLSREILADGIKI
jgi:hypothetical protein